MIEIQRKHVTSKILGTLDDKIIRALRQRLRYKIPGFRFAFARRTKWSGDGYKYLITPKLLKFPSGLLYLVEEILNKHKVSYKITDLRTKPVPSDPIPPKYYKLRDYQEAIEKVCLDAGTGIVRAATGAGKTAVFTSMLGRLNGLKRIVYVRKLDLMEQTIRVLERELEIPIGKIGAGVADIQELSVAMIPTVSRALGEKFIKYQGHEDDDDDDTIELSAQQKLAIKKYVEEAECFVIDECHCISAPSVQMVSGHSKNAYYRFGFCITGDATVYTENGPQIIADLYSGNYRGRVWSHGEHGVTLKKISHITRRVSDNPLYKIKTLGGSVLKATGNHPILTDSGYKTADKLKIGDKILSVPYQPGRTLYDFDTFYKTHRFITFPSKTIEDDTKYRALISEKQNGGKNRATKIKLESKFGTLGNFNAWWARREVSHINRFIQRLQSYSLTDYDIGLLFGIMIGDGHLMKDGHTYSLIYTSNKSEIHIVAEYLDSLNVPFSKYKHQGEWTPDHRESNCQQIKISGVLPRFFAEEKFPIGNKTKIGFDVPQIIMKGSQDIKIGFLRGLFFSDGTVYQTKRRNFIEIKLSQVKEVKLDDSFLSDIQSLLIEQGVKTLFKERYQKRKRGIYILTESKIAFLRDIGFWQGPKQDKAFASYRLLQGLPFSEKEKKEWQDKVVKIERSEVEFVYDIIDVNNTHNFIANNLIVHNSATPWRTDGTDILLNAATGPQLIDISASELIKRGFLVPPRVHFYKVPRDWKQKVPGDYQSVYTQFIVENEDRNNRIVKLTKFLVENEEKPVILVQRQKHGKILEEKLQKVGLVAKFIYGESSMTDRWLTLQDFEAGVIDVVIGSSILQEGIDLPCITALINAAAGKSSSAYYQKIGRAIRTNDGKTRAIVIDFLDQVKWLKNHANERMRILKTEPLYELKVQE